MSVNKVILLGNVGRDPETKQASSGMSVTNFSVATEKKYKDEKKTQWHNCVAFGKTADIIQQFVSKGSKVYIEGEINYEEYTSKDGVKKSATKILVVQIQFLGSAGEARQDTQEPKEYQGFTSGQMRAKSPAASPESTEFDDSNPF